MKSIFIFVLLVFLSFCENRKNQKIPEQERLQGKVKEVSVRTYQAIEKFGKITTGKLLPSEIETEALDFNKAMNLENLLDTMSFIDFEQFFSIDGIIYFLTHNFNLVFDRKGKKVETNLYNQNGILDGKIIYKYDSKKNRIEANIYNPQGFLEGKIVYKYNEKEERIEEGWYNSDGSLFAKFRYEYDEKGNKIKTNSYGFGGTQELKMAYKYDKKGNKIQTNAAGEKMIYKYISKERKIEIHIYNHDNFLSRKLIYRYDDRGNKTEIKIYDSNNFLHYQLNYKYKYDKKQNWIQRIKYRIENSFEKPLTITKREIIYF